MIFEVIDAEMLAEYGIHSAFEKYCGQLTLEDIFTTDSVYLAAKECASGFRDRPDTNAFMSGATKHSQDLCERVLNGTFVPRYHHGRLINERGKMRIIKPPTFECKVVQKVICNIILRAILESRMIYNNYASIRGKGNERLYTDVLNGINGIRKRMHSPVIVMTDFANFFGSINNDILEKKIFERYIADRRVTRLLRSFSPEPYGLSLGNEVSQVPASFYPSCIDHWAKDRMGMKCYYRYADDILFVAEAEDAQGIIRKIRELAADICLTIKDEKITIIPYGDNFTYCKERYIFNKEKEYYYRLINPSIPQRQSHKISSFTEKVKSGEMPALEAKNQQKCVMGVIASHPNTYKIVNRLQAKYDALMLLPPQE